MTAIGYLQLRQAFSMVVLLVRRGNYLHYTYRFFSLFPILEDHKFSLLQMPMIDLPVFDQNMITDADPLILPVTW